MIKIPKSEWFDLLALAYGLLMVTAQGLTLPLYWDTANFLVSAGQQMLDSGFLLSYVTYHTDYPHTFLLPLLFGVILKFTDQSYVYLHWLGYFLSVSCLIVMYQVGKIFGNRVYAFSCASLLLTNPLFQAQTILSYHEVIGMALRYLALFFIVKKNYRLFFLSAVVAFTARFENGFILPCVAVIMSFLDPEVKESRRTLWLYSFLLGLMTLGWLLFHLYLTGWVFYSPERSFDENPSHALSEAIKYLLLDQGRYFLTLIGLGSLVLFSLAKKSVSKPVVIAFLPFVLGALPTLVIVGELGYFLPRYILPLLPLILLSALYVLSKVTKTYVFITIVVLTHLVQWQYLNRCYSPNYEDCRLIIPYLEEKRRFSQKIEQLPQKSVLVNDIEYHELLNPKLGYVSESLHFKVTNVPQRYDAIYFTPTSFYLESVASDSFTLIDRQEFGSNPSAAFGIYAAP